MYEQNSWVIFVFYDVYLMLCKEKNISPSAAAIQAGINKGTVSVWKKKREKNVDVDPDKSTIDKLSSFFGVTEAKLRELTEIYSELAPAAQDAVVNREFAELPIATRQAMLDGIKKVPVQPDGGEEEFMQLFRQLSPEVQERELAYLRQLAAHEAAQDK